MTDVVTGRPGSVAVKPAGVGQGVTLAIAGFLPTMAVVALSPAVPGILGRFAEVPHAATLVPLMVTTPGLVVALLAPLAGLTVDRFGRRGPLVLAILLYAVFGIAPFFLENLTAIFGARLLVGGCEAFILVSVNTLLTDYFNVDQRRGWLTLQAAVTPFLAVGLIVLSGLASTLAWNGAFLVYAGVIPVLLAVALVCFEPKRALKTPTSKALESPFPWRRVSVLCGVALFSFIIFYVFIVEGSLAFASLGVTSPAQIGGLIALASIGVPVGAAIFFFLSRRLRAEWCVALSLALLGLGTAGVGLAPTIALMVTAGLVQQIGAGVIVGSSILWASQILPAEHRGRGFGLWTSASFLGQFLSPLAVGLARGIFDDILSAFVAIGVVSLIGAVVVGILARRPTPVAS